MQLYSAPLSAVDEEVVKEARRFAREEIAPQAERWERERVQPDLIRRLIGRFTKIYIPRSLGGLGASSATICRELEELAWADYGVTFAFEVHNHATMMVSMIENDALRQRYLGKLMGGEMMGAFLLTEPGAGSDAASIRCTAALDGDRYILNGEKAWVTNAGSADALLVFAQTGTRARDIVCLLVERSWPGVEYLGPYDMTGAHAALTGAFRFTDCAVPAENVAFPAGEAFKKAMGAIDFARFAIASMCNGAFQGALEAAVDYCRQRVQFGKPVMENQAISWRLADQLTALEASRMLTYLAADQLDRGQPATVAAAHCKKYAVQAAYDGVSRAMQCMGSNGLKREYPLARQLAALTITFNTDGTNDICDLVIGRSL